MLGSAELFKLWCLSREILLWEMQVFWWQCKVQHSLKSHYILLMFVWYIFVADMFVSLFKVSKNQYHCDGCGICRCVFLNNLKSESKFRFWCSYSICRYWIILLVFILQQNWWGRKLLSLWSLWYANFPFSFSLVILVMLH